MIAHILVSLDGSSLAECVLPHVVACARALGARVTLLRVLDELTTEGAVPISPVNWHLVRAQGQRYLEDVAQKLEELGCEVDTVLLEGKAAEEIISFVERHDVDLLILSSHGRSGLYRWNVSSVAQKVIFEAHSSILIVRAYRATDVSPDSFHYEKILVPLDCSRRAECVLPLATLLAKENDGTLLLAHVVVPPQLPRHVPLTEHERALVAEVVELNLQAAETYLRQLSASLEVKNEVRLLSSHDAAGALHDLVDAEEPDLIVMCAHGHTGARRWPFASLALNMLVYSSVPLLIVQDVTSHETHASWVIAAKESKGH